MGQSNSSPPHAAAPLDIPPPRARHPRNVLSVQQSVVCYWRASRLPSRRSAFGCGPAGHGPQNRASRPESGRPVQFFQKEGGTPPPPYGEVGVEAWEKGKRVSELAAAPHAGPPWAEASSPHTLRTKVWNGHKKKGTPFLGVPYGSAAARLELDVVFVVLFMAVGVVG